MRLVRAMKMKAKNLVQKRINWHTRAIIDRFAIGQRNARFMKNLISISVFCGVIAGALEIEPVAAAGKSKFNKVLTIGDKAPAWSDLPGVDGKRHDLSEYREAKVVVLVFTCNHCPVSRKYEERLIQLAGERGKQLQIVAISVSHNSADRLDKMKVRAAESKLPYPYLYDESQQSARAYGATVTPHFFVLDTERRIAYMGAFDDNFMDPEKAEKHFLTDAVEAVLAGKVPPVKESLQRGCAIDYE